jgi:hypothetical protein
MVFAKTVTAGLDAEIESAAAIADPGDTPSFGAMIAGLAVCATFGRPSRRRVGTKSPTGSAELTLFAGLPNPRHRR